MRDKVKCSIIDAMLMGQDIFVSRTYEGSALITVDPGTIRERELFNWRHKSDAWDKRLVPTLKDALSIVDDHWDKRLEIS